MASYEDREQPTERAPRPAESPRASASSPPPFGATQPLRPGPEPFRAEVPANETVVLRAGPPSFAWLAAINGPWAGHLFRLNPKGTVLGRDARSDIILDDEAVSNLHAKVRQEGEEDNRPKFYIQDLASTNGTFVNGEAITKCPLKDGDRIVVGQITLVFKQV
jgi:hypothetical protein